MSDILDSLIDAQLPAAARGDRDAYGRIVAGCQSTVTSIALAIVRDVPASEDIAQEAFLSAWQNLRKLNNRASFLPWLRQITRNLARDYLRARGLRANPATDVEALIATVADPHPGPDEQLATDQDRAIAASGGADFASATRRPSQLFVARSLQLCELVRRYQQHNANDDLAANVECLYMRMRHFLADVEGKLISAATAESATGEERRFYQTHRESDCVDFGRFARDIFPVISASVALCKVKVASGGAAGAAIPAPGVAVGGGALRRSGLKGSYVRLLAMTPCTWIPDSWAKAFLPTTGLL